MGGSAPGALRRAGRLADGWLASFLTPAEAGAGRLAIEAAAAEAGREIEPDHFGISLAVATGPALAALHAVARQRRPGTDPAELVAGGWADARSKIEDYVAAGLTKFVIRPGGTSLTRGSSPTSSAAKSCRCRHDAAMRVTIRVRPGAGRTQVGGEHAGALLVRVGAPAVDGRATEAALAAVALRLVSGGVRSRWSPGPPAGPR